MPAVEGKEASVHLADWPAMKPQYLDSALDEKWSARLALRSDVMKALENARAAKIIGHPLDADVTIYAEGDAYETLKAMGDFLSDFFIVSNVELVNDTSAAPADALTNEDGVRVSVAPSTRQKKNGFAIGPNGIIPKDLQGKPKKPKNDFYWEVVFWCLI